MAKTELKNSTDTLEALQDYLRRYTPATQETVFDLLKNRYCIEVNNPLPEYDTKTARAYSVTETSDDPQNLIAYICEPCSYLRHSAMAKLVTVEHPNILKLVAYGNVELSQPRGQRFVIIYERPVGKKLSAMLQGRPAQISNSYIIERIITPLFNAINELQSQGLSHGCINLDNVYFSDKPVLAPMVLEPCGFSQLFYYESIERLQALPYAKGEGTVSHDYYALAIMVMEMLFGEAHFSVFAPTTLARLMLREGAYNALTRGKDLPEQFNDFIRGLITLTPRDRWTSKNIKIWIEGKRFNVLSPPQPMDALRPYEFQETQAVTRRELAYLFSINIPAVPEVVQSYAFLQWVTLSLRNKELTENISRVSRALGNINAKNQVLIYEQVMYAVAYLDPLAPVCLNNLLMHVDGVDSLCVELFKSDSQPEQQLLIKFIELSMASLWADLQRKKDDFKPDNPIAPQITTMIAKLERMRSYIRNVSLGFGPERMLYDLNPELHCLSPFCADKHVNTLNGLLIALDEKAATNSATQDPIDRHIAAFIASKLGLQQEIKLHELQSIPMLVSNRSIIALKFIALAQNKTRNLRVPGLTHWLALRIDPSLDILKSRSLKKKIRETMRDKAKSGNSSLLSDIIIESNYASVDHNGYNDAIQTYAHNELLIEHYQTDALLEKLSVRLAFNISRFVAYAAICTSVIISLNMGS